MKIKKDRSFEKDSVLIFCMMMLGNLCGVIFQLISGRILQSTSLYADLNALFSFYTILIWPASVITFVVTRYITIYDGNGENAKINEFLKKTAFIVIIVVFLITLMGKISEGRISVFLRIEDSKLITLIIGMVDVALFQSIINGGLQGTKSFFEYGLMTLMGQLCKIVSMIIVLGKNNQLEVFFFALLCGAVFTMLVGFIGIKRKTKKTLKEKLKIDKREFYEYCLVSIIANIGLTLLANVDMLLVKYYFDNEAGLYSVAIVLGKIITYFSGAIVVVLFPFAVNAGENEKYALKLLKKSLIYNSILTCSAAFVLNIVGQYLIYFIYGEAYKVAVDYLFPVTLLVMPIGVITTVFNYILARKECRDILKILVGGILLEILVVVLVHPTLKTVIYEMACVLWSTFVLSLIKIYTIYKNRN